MRILPRPGTKAPLLIQAPCPKEVRSLFKGTMGFGLVSIPVQVFKALDAESVTTHWLHEACHTRIQYQKYCPACSSVVDTQSIKKGAPLEDGRWVILPEENPTEASDHVISIFNFPLLNDIDPVFYDQAYWLKPGAGGSRAYAILVAAMREMGRVALAEMTLRTRPSLAIVRAYNERTLILHRMHYPESLRTEGEAFGDVATSYSDKELALARALIDQMQEPFVAADYPNHRREARLRQIESLSQTASMPAVESTNQAALSLMEQLRQSVELQSHHGKGGVG